MQKQLLNKCYSFPKIQLVPINASLASVAYLQAFNTGCKLVINRMALSPVLFVSAVFIMCVQYSNVLHMVGNASYSNNFTSPQSS